MSNESLQPTAYDVRPRKDKTRRQSDFRCAAIRSSVVRRAECGQQRS